MDQTRISKETTAFFEKVLEFVREDYPGFKCELRMDWSPNRTRSRGGKYATGLRISIAMLKYVKEGKVKFHEYASFVKDLTIGGFVHKDYTLPLRAVICHEVAHTLHRHIQPIKSRRGRPHGDEWQKLYKSLRVKFINPYIDRTVIMDKLPDTYEADKKEYVRNCRNHRMKPEWFDVWFNIDWEVDKYRIRGWKPRARKYFVRVERGDGKFFSMNPKDIIEGFKINTMELT